MAFNRNGLYITAKVLLKHFKKNTINPEKYIEEMRNLFDLYEEVMNVDTDNNIPNS